MTRKRPSEGLYRQLIRPPGGLSRSFLLKIRPNSGGRFLPKMGFRQGKRPSEGLYRQLIRPPGGLSRSFLLKIRPNSGGRFLPKMGFRQGKRPSEGLYRQLIRPPGGLSRQGKPRLARYASNRRFSFKEKLPWGGPFGGTPVKVV